jgi:hypothetical protein
MTGGNSTATAAAGKNAKAGTEAQITGGTIDATAGAMTLSGGVAQADNTLGTFAQANADAIFTPQTTIKLKTTGGNIDINGGASTIVGSSARALTLAGTESGASQVGLLMELRPGADLNLLSGTEVGGTEARANAALFYGGEIKIFLIGSSKLRLTGAQGSGLFQVIGNTFQRQDGTHYPITVSGGSIQLIQNLALGDALVVSGAPPLNLASLQSPLLVALDSSRQARIDSFSGDKNLFMGSNSGKKQCN